jgi:hypothetical protein
MGDEQLTSGDFGEVVDIAEPSELERRSPKEKAANWIAKALLFTFGFILVLVLVGGFFLMRTGDAETTKKIVNESAIPYLEKVGTFASTVFGPLLAFILGYYFAKDK